MKPRQWLFLFLALLTGFRFLLAASYELSSDECYYYLWSQHPALSYFSKGPGVAFAIRASTALFGATEFGVRFFSPLLALGTSLIVYFFARHVYDERVAIWTVILLNTIPIFNVGAIVMTIDPLSIFFWAASLYTFWLALEESPRFTWWWPFTGLLIGLGFLAKYTNAIEILSILIVLGTTKRYRRDLQGTGFWSLIIVVVLCTIPVFVWNQQHAWITLTPAAVSIAASPSAPGHSSNSWAGIAWSILRSSSPACSGASAGVSKGGGCNLSRVSLGHSPSRCW